MTNTTFTNGRQVVERNDVDNHVNQFNNWWAMNEVPAGLGFSLATVTDIDGNFVTDFFIKDDE